MVRKASGGLVQQRVCVRRGDVQTSSVVLLINFSNRLKRCAPKPARTQSPKTLAEIPQKVNIKNNKQND
jgi:hypothetical protein